MKVVTFNQNSHWHGIDAECFMYQLCSIWKSTEITDA